MNRLLIVGLICAHGLVPVAGAQAAESTQRSADECGDPTIVNQGYDAELGQVVEVISGDTVLVRFAGERANPYGHLDGNVKVRLVAIEAPSIDLEIGRRSREALDNRLGGKPVNLALSPVQPADGPVNALVARPGANIEAENLAQVEAGLARAVEQGPYDVDWYIRCELERAQERARRGRLGIWKGEESMAH